jgi:N-acetylmuramoyl-L-alanine amidase
LKKIVAFFVLVVFFSIFYISAYAYENNIVVDNNTIKYNVPDISITVDGNKFNTGSNPPLIIDNNTIIPLRSISEGLGAKVEWNDSTQTVTVTTKDKMIKLVIGENYATVNGNKILLPLPAMLINRSTTYVPMRFLFENLGYNVDWIGDKYLIQVTKIPDISTPNKSSKINIINFTSTFSNGIYTISVTADGPLEYTQGTISDVNNFRVYFDFKNAIDTVSNNLITINNNGLNAAYIGQNQLNPAITRFVVSMNGSMPYYVTQSQDKREFDISFKIGQSTTANTILNYTANNTNDFSQKPLIYIDPGHGGSDPGAIGINGVHEADIALAIGLKLKTLLDNNGYRTMISRSSDTYVDLYDRANQANNAGADAFISIHCDAYGSPSANGTTVLYYPNGYNGDTRDNKTFAQIIHDNLMKEINTTDRGLSERPNLVVLNQTKMPAVLVETGFVTSPTDVQLLTNDNFQWKVAQGIYNGIVEYFEKLKNGSIKTTIS